MLFEVFFHFWIVFIFLDTCWPSSSHAVFSYNTYLFHCTFKGLWWMCALKPHQVLTGALCTCSQKLAGMIQEGIKIYFIKVLPHFWASQEREAFVGIGSWRKTGCFMGFDATAGPPPTDSYVNSALHQEAEECVIVPAMGELPISHLFLQGIKYFSKSIILPMVLLHDSQQPVPRLLALFKGNVKVVSVWGSKTLWPEAGAVFIGKKISWISRGNCILLFMFHVWSWPTVTSQGFKYCTKSERYCFVFSMLKQGLQVFRCFRCLVLPSAACFCNNFLFFSELFYRPIT